MNAPSMLEEMPVKCHVHQHSLPLSHRNGDTRLLLPVPLLWGYMNIPALLLHHILFSHLSYLLTPKLFRSQQNGSLLIIHQQPHRGHVVPKEVSSSSRETCTCSVTSRGIVKGTATLVSLWDNPSTRSLLTQSTESASCKAGKVFPAGRQYI